VQQPTHLVFAPGDNNNMYWVERTTSSGTNAKFKMGRVVKYDLTTGTPSTFLDFSTGSNGPVPNDAGSLALTFHPDFQINGKFYTTWAADPTPVSNELREYKLVGGVPQFQRTILKYPGNQGSFHTIDWIGFKHLPSGDPGRNHLYVTTGDGGPTSNQTTYVAKSQDLSTVYGKVLRVDISDGADAYPADANKNFGIPSINTFAGTLPNQTTGTKLGEVIASGLRNPFRASFDRHTNDLFIGDVGFNTQEEIDFLNHEAINGPGVQNFYDFGWAKREGVIANPDSTAGVAGPKGDSIDPIIVRTATTGDDGVSDNSITGGYVYRGPIPSLRGKYIFADYVAGRVYTLNMNREQDPATFNGDDYTNFEDVTALWESATFGGFDLTRISSFGEDNDGNLYLVSLADNLSSAYDSINEGAIYRVSFVPEPGGAAVIAITALALLLRRR
jgi:glucose/arabinose dehydrogenase